VSISRLFVGTPEMMQLMLTSDFYIKFRTANMTAMHELYPLAGSASYQHQVGHGFETLLGIWLKWNHVPIAEIPLDGPAYLLWATLRTPHIGNYCNGTLEQVASWTDMHCITEQHKFGPPLHSYTEAVSSPAAQSYCSNWTAGLYPSQEH
jgi:hypothetical protein